jgi:HK97 family phage prohead protease
MKRKVRNFVYDVKEVDEEGHFSGYASVYNVIDAYRERVAPGAFAATLRKWQSRGRLPPALWQHRSGEPVGPFTLMREDEKGLYTEGQLLVNDVQRAREARALMKSKTVDGLSIGFNSVVEEWNNEEKILTLKEIDLWEVSIVTFPANSESLITEVRSMFAEGVPSIKEIEEILRDAGFSRSQAKALVGHGYAGLLRDAEGRSAKGIGKSVLDEIVSEIKSITTKSPISVQELLS